MNKNFSQLIMHYIIRTISSWKKPFDKQMQLDNFHFAHTPRNQSSIANALSKQTRANVVSIAYNYGIISMIERHKKNDYFASIKSLNYV